MTNLPESPSESATPPKSDYHHRRIGSLWVKSSKAGNKYLSGVLEIRKDDGSIEKININVLKTNFKVPGDRRPDYDIVLQSVDRPKETLLDAEAGL